MIFRYNICREFETEREAKAFSDGVNFGSEYKLQSRHKGNIVYILDHGDFDQVLKVDIPAQDD